MDCGPSIIVERLGVEQTARLSAILGGVQITVPTTIDASVFNSGRLRSRVGDGLFALLVFHFGGSRLYVPKMTDRTGHPRIDPAAVSRLTKRGWSASRIARKLGCSDRTVYAQRAKIRLEGNSE